MSILYRKTAKGQAEIETRAHRLAPRLRSALILVDGKKPDDELARMIPTEPAATLASLQADGFIEVVATLAERPAARRDPPAAEAPARPTARETLPIEALRREAARDLGHQLGPNAEFLALKIERAKTMPELGPLLGQGAQMLRALKGPAAAEAFAARFIAKPPP